MDRRLSLSAAEIAPLLRFPGALQPADERRETVREKPQTIDGKTVEGGSLNQGFDDLQLRIGDQARAPASRGLRFHTFH